MQTAGVVALCLVFCAVAIVWAGSLAFVCGLAAYAHVFQHFLKGQQEIAAVRVQKALQEQARKQIDRQQFMERMKEKYGELPEPHQDVIQDELEKVLSAGPRR